MANMFYRPEWTCGRYNSEHGVAICYNLIEGMSYYFEDDSAEIIGSILSCPRNGKVDINEISLETNTDIDCLRAFFDELISLNLLMPSLPTKEDIMAYRENVCDFRRSSFHTAEKTTKAKLPVAISTAEMDYTERVGGVTSVMFELTYRCSEKCVHCYNIGATRNDEEVSHRADVKELSLNDYKRIIDQLYDQGLIKICLSGGDPFSCSFVWDIIDYLYHKDIAIDIYTNGQLLINNVQKLARYYPRNVGVSIYSGDANIHDAITRINGSWEKSMDVVRQLTELAVITELKCCVMRPNVKSYWKVAEIAKKYGAVAHFEISITDSIEGDKCASKYLRLTPEMLEVVLRDDNIPLYVGKEAPNYGGQRKDLNANACGAGENTFCITPDGDLIPCCAFHLSFGNLKHHSIKEILYNNPKLKEWQNLKLSDYEECGQHDYCDYCNLCAGNNYTEHGTPLKAGENNCYLAKIRHGLAYRMKDGCEPLRGMSLVERLNLLNDTPSISLRRVFDDHRDAGK